MTSTLPPSAPPPGDSTPTALLVSRAQEGDKAAAGRLLQRAMGRVRLFVRLRLGPRLRTQAETDDVLQDACLEALRALPGYRYRGEGSFTRWLCQIVENRLRGLADHHGAQKRTPPGQRESLTGLPLHGHAGPETEAHQREDTQALLGAVDALEDGQREVLLLRFFQGRTIEDVAGLTGRSPTSVRRLLGSACLALGRRLGGRT